MEINLVPYGGRYYRDSGRGTENFRVFIETLHIGYVSIEFNETTNHACGHYQLQVQGKGAGRYVVLALKALIEELGYVFQLAPFFTERSYRLWMKIAPELVDHVGEGVGGWYHSVNNQIALHGGSL